MATCTFAARILIDLKIVVSAPTMVDGSQQRATGTTENATLEARVCDMAAAKVESILGPVGAFDGTDATVGDQKALDVALRLALHYYLHDFTLIQTPETQALKDAIIKEIKELNDMRLGEIPPQLGEVDLTDLDKLYPTSPDWNSDV